MERIYIIGEDNGIIMVCSTERSEFKCSRRSVNAGSLWNSNLVAKNLVLLECTEF